MITAIYRYDPTHNGPLGVCFHIIHHVIVFHIIPYVNCFGRIVLCVFIEYCIVRALKALMSAW